MGCKTLQLQDYFHLIDGNNDYGNDQTKNLTYNSWEFNKFGQLVKIEKGSDVVKYLYNTQGRVLKRTSNGMKQYYTYTPLEQLETKSLGAPYESENKTAIATLKYIYATDGSIHSRIVNGAKQSYKYDQIGQLTAVLNAAGGKVEQYTYDDAGNILKKDIDGSVTTYTYDKSNQLVSSTVKVKTTDYEYDAAGRLVKEGGKTYAYGWLDKVMNITKNGKISNSYTYSMNGQIASADIAGKTENFLWDGLALIKRGTTEYVYEPAVTGGNPILANGKAMFNDMLGNTLGIIGEKDKFTSIKRDAFGKTFENSMGSQYNMFTGKPKIGGLGYAFLFRNYRPNLGKWQTADPIGYPDGWNNLAYCNNGVTNSIDSLGLASWQDQGAPLIGATNPYPATIIRTDYVTTTTNSITISGVTYVAIYYYYMITEYSSFIIDTEVKYYGGTGVPEIGDTRTKETTATYRATSKRYRTLYDYSYILNGTVVFSDTGIESEPWSFSAASYNTGTTAYIELQSQIYE